MATLVSAARVVVFFAIGMLLAGHAQGVEGLSRVIYVISSTHSAKVLVDAEYVGSVNEELTIGTGKDASHVFHIAVEADGFTPKYIDRKISPSAKPLVLKLDLERASEVTGGGVLKLEFHSCEVKQVKVDGINQKIDDLLSGLNLARGDHDLLVTTEAGKIPRSFQILGSNLTLSIDCYRSLEVHSIPSGSQILQSNGPTKITDSPISPSSEGFRIRRPGHADQQESKVSVKPGERKVFLLLHEEIGEPSNPWLVSTQSAMGLGPGRYAFELGGGGPGTFLTARIFSGISNTWTRFGIDGGIELATGKFELAIGSVFNLQMRGILKVRLFHFQNVAFGAHLGLGGWTTLTPDPVLNYGGVDLSLGLSFSYFFLSRMSLTAGFHLVVTDDNLFRLCKDQYDEMNSNPEIHPVTANRLCISDLKLPQKTEEREVHPWLFGRLTLEVAATRWLRLWIFGQYGGDAQSHDQRRRDMHALCIDTMGMQGQCNYRESISWHLRGGLTIIMGNSR